LIKSLIFDKKVWFLVRISIFGRNFDFWSKFRFVVRISIFTHNFDLLVHFWRKWLFVSENSDLCPKFLMKTVIFFRKLRFLTKISIFYRKKLFFPNSDFWANFCLWPNVRFLNSVLTIYDSGAVFDPAILDITQDDIRSRFLSGVANVASVSLAIGYPTVASVPHSIANGFKNLMAVAAATEIEFQQVAQMKVKNKPARG